MHIQRLQELIEEPGKTQLSDREGLIEWVKKYPYAGAFSMLLARSSAVGGHIHQQDDLMRAAAGSSLRQPLFDLILRTELVEEARRIDAHLEASPSVPELETVDVEPGVDPPLDEPSENTPHKNGLDAEDPMEREALIAAIGRSIESDVASWNTDEEPAAHEEMSQADGERLRNAASSPFSAWLTLRAETLNYGEASAPAGTESEGKPVNASELIDRFIASKPRIGPLRESASEVHDLAQASVMEDPTLVTETMARLYAKQGQIGKARKAYKLLAMKNPAKSTYFAAQLKKLNKGG
jgi:hypothetical protein